MQCVTARVPSPPSSDRPQVDVEKCCVVAEAGITLVDLQRQLAPYGLAMHNLGSISTQALGGVLATATHGTGLQFKVLPGDVIALTVLLASGELVSCSRAERRALFLATLAGVGCTGLVVTVQLALEPAFRLREVQETVPFEDVVRGLDGIVTRSEHVRLWWYPQSRAVRVSSADRTAKVQVRAPRPPAVDVTVDVGPSLGCSRPSQIERRVIYAPSFLCRVPRRPPRRAARRPSGACCSRSILWNSCSSSRDGCRG